MSGIHFEDDLHVEGAAEISGSSGKTSQVLKLAVGQTEPFLDLEDSEGKVLSSVGADGTISASAFPGAFYREHEGNLAVGSTLPKLTTGKSTTSFGVGAHASLTEGNYDNAFGYEAQLRLTTGTADNAFGHQAQYNLTAGNYDNAFGHAAQYNLTTGTYDNAFGYAAQHNLTTGNYDNAFGHAAQYHLTTGTADNAFGHPAQYNLTAGNYDNAFGHAAQYNLTTGTADNAFGYAAQHNLTSIIATLGSVTGGSAYTDGVYEKVTLTKQSGVMRTAPTAKITVAEGKVTTVELETFGTGVDLTTVLSAAAASIGGTGSGFSVPVASVTAANNNNSLGYRSLFENQTGSGNLTLGHEAGYHETGSNMLYVANNATKPWIKGSLSGEGIAFCGKEPIKPHEAAHTETTAAIWTHLENLGLA